MYTFEYEYNIYTHNQDTFKGIFEMRSVLSRIVVFQIMNAEIGGVALALILGFHARVLTEIGTSIAVLT